MPFQKGQSGNPGGRTRKGWLTEQRKIVEAKRTWAKLLAIRDGLIRQQETDSLGHTYDVVASHKDLRETCKLILAYSVGQPKQQVEHTGEDGGPITLKWVE
jgi:hypothetical protein